MPPIVALLTDFGLRDPYVGAMKGAILTVSPAASLVDLTHEVAPHDVMEAALALEAAYRFFPPGTVFLAVVDPGVGSGRRALALAAAGFLFVGPDNGVFSLVLAAHGEARLHLVENAALFRSPLSPVFHGRDLFAPAAAWLAAGGTLARLGPTVVDPVRLALPIPERGSEACGGVVIHVDRFGNLTTNLTEADVAELAGSGAVEVLLSQRTLPLVRTYADVPEGEACALVGSAGRIEIAVNRASAAERLGAGRGASVRVRRSRGLPVIDCPAR